MSPGFTVTWLTRPTNRTRVKSILRLFLFRPFRSVLPDQYRLYTHNPLSLDNLNSSFSFIFENWISLTPLDFFISTWLDELHHINIISTPNTKWMHSLHGSTPCSNFTTFCQWSAVPHARGTPREHSCSQGKKNSSRFLEEWNLFLRSSGKKKFLTIPQGMKSIPEFSCQVLTSNPSWEQKLSGAQNVLFLLVSLNQGKLNFHQLVHYKKLKNNNYFKIIFFI